MSAVGLRVGVGIGVGAVERLRLSVKPPDTPREHEDGHEVAGHAVTGQPLDCRLLREPRSVWEAHEPSTPLVSGSGGRLAESLANARGVDEDGDAASSEQQACSTVGAAVTAQRNTGEVSPRRSQVTRSRSQQRGRGLHWRERGADRRIEGVAEP